MRNCSNTEAREKRFQELTTLLVERNYNKKTVEATINKVKELPREMVLKKRPKKQQKENNRPVFSVYDPRMPALQNIQAKHWRAMKSQDQYLSKVFPEPRMVGFRRQRNLKDHLIRAKVPTAAPIYPQRERKGMNKCGKCSICPFIKEGKEIKIQNKPNWSINKRVDCDSTNIIYLIECSKETCKERYVGETERRLKDRLADHRVYVTNKVVTQPTGAHFNLPGHSVSNDYNIRTS